MLTRVFPEPEGQAFPLAPAGERGLHLGRTDAFWIEEYYDHIIRDMDDFHNQLIYLKRNPARIPNWPWRWT